MIIARNKNQNTFAKRQREQDKRRKAEDKLKRRLDRRVTETSPLPARGVPAAGNPFTAPGSHSGSQAGDVG